ncbi:MAG: ATP-binding protein [Kofleriaceae bacterium]
MRSATVDMYEIERGVRFDISLPEERGVRARIRRWASSRRDVKHAAAELEDAMTALERRYAELDAARQSIEQQRIALDTAYKVGHRIWGDLEPTAVVQAALDELQGVTSLDAIRIEVTTDASAVIDARRGTAPGRAADVSTPVRGSHATGQIEAWISSNLPGAQALLELVGPTVSLALNNALAYQELRTYQRGLETLVEERTAELTLARDELAGTVIQLREAQGVRERFFAHVNHEFRAPLSLISLAVPELEARLAEAPDARSTQALTTVASQSRKLLRLVDEQLLAAQGAEIGMKVAPVPLDFARMVGEIADVWRPAATAAGLGFSWHAPPTVEGMADPDALERIITNLLSNAIKYTPVGGEVELVLEEQGEAVVIAVRDRGIGLDDELLERLFSRYARGKDVGDRQGTGLGLALVKQLVDAHHGSVTGARRAGGGSEFRIVLPRLAPAVAQGAPVPAKRAFAPRLRPEDYDVATRALESGHVMTPPGTSLGTILVAEDDPRLAARIATVLADDYKVIIARDGRAALELVAPHQPHLLVTDIEMPHMDGLELAARFREASRDRVAPVLILSAIGDLSTRVAGLEAGAVDYMVKPFDPRELKARVRAQFRMRDLAVRLHRAEQLSALATLSTGLAHELRNPANGVVNAVGPLTQMLPPALREPGAPTAQLLDVIRTCADQIGALSRHLLDFRGEVELAPRDTPLGDLVDRALILSQGALSRVKIETLLAEPSRRIHCAPALVTQVLTNLIENAAHAAGPGGWVKVTAPPLHDQRFVVEVSDSGPGVPVDLRERIFEPFFTTKAPGVGTGLGLPLARDVAHRHGGVLEIRERDGQSCFVLELPQPGKEASR